MHTVGFGHFVSKFDLRQLRQNQYPGAVVDMYIVRCTYRPICINAQWELLTLLYTREWREEVMTDVIAPTQIKAHS